MKKNLVIVESPAKAKTIEKFLGSDYQVKSSFGHIRDLPKKGLSIDVEHDFKPTYEISTDKKSVIKELSAAAKNNQVWLASDEDREGEAIAWHLCIALKLNPAETKRIVFHEITKTAIDKAVANPRKVDMHLVDAQQARRVLDRLVGYELSPILWKKVRPGLSAGRVQSVAVRLIVEREREIKNFASEASFKLSGTFLNSRGDEINGVMGKRLAAEAEARKLLEALKEAAFSVQSVAEKQATRNPAPPFTTSSLQQEASRRLGFSVKQTMTLAQRLYESGQITYMRTDSTSLSELALGNASAYILKNFGPKYHQRRQYQTKNTSAQEAHEAIRPTNFHKTSGGFDAQQKRLYELIWRRALASQMSAAKMAVSEITIAASQPKDSHFMAQGERLLFDGYWKVYGGSKDDVILPKVEQGEKLTYAQIAAKQMFSRPPARYSEATLVKRLEELGIGRPSTYAPTISTIQTRGYVENATITVQVPTARELILSNGEIAVTDSAANPSEDKNKLVPTHVAEVTNDFLVKNFPTIVDFDFTARAEADFDDIAEGQKDWVATIKSFYSTFHPLVDKAATVSREDASQARLLGNDPTTKKPIYARYGRYGPMLQRGESTDAEVKPDFAPIPTDSTLETVTFEQALSMFRLPREVGTTSDGQMIKANIGRFGPYIQVGKLFVSIKDLDPLTITEADARSLYEAKLTAEANKIIAEFDGGIKVLNGQYGPYITDGKTNIRVPKSQDAAKLTKAAAMELFKKAPAKKNRFKSRSKRRA